MREKIKIQLSSKISAAYSISSMLSSGSEGSYIIDNDLILLEEMDSSDYLEDNKAYLGLLREANKRGLEI